MHGDASTARPPSRPGGGSEPAALKLRDGRNPEGEVSVHVGSRGRGKAWGRQGPQRTQGFALPSSKPVLLKRCTFLADPAQETSSF